MVDPDFGDADCEETQPVAASLSFPIGQTFAFETIHVDVSRIGRRDHGRHHNQRDGDYTADEGIGCDAITRRGHRVESRPKCIRPQVEGFVAGFMAAEVDRGPRKAKARIAAANFEHGRYSKAGRESRKALLEARKIKQRVNDADMAEIRAARILVENQQREELKQRTRTTSTDLLVVPHNA